MRVPPGVTQRDFAAAIKQFEKIVGPEWVFTSDADLDLYRDSYSPYLGEPEERVASAAVAPTETSQVQEIVRVANKYKIPLYTISTGKNLGYGGSAPVYSGCVVVDLKRMNKIIEVNEKNAYAIVEPGVAYFDLYKHLKEKGIKLWLDVPDPGWGSLVGNALDRGAGFTYPHLRTHVDAICGMEIVLANGEVMRTGMGAMPNAQTWQQNKYGIGPWVDGIFTQSNFGIVTKVGFWLAPEPDAFLKGSVLLSGYDDLVPFVDIMNYLENSGVTNGMPDIGSPLLCVPQYTDFDTVLAGGGPMPPPDLFALVQKSGNGHSPELVAYGKEHGLPYWKCSLAFYGPAKAIREQWEYAKEKFSVIPGVRFEDEPVIKLPLSEDMHDKVQLTQFGIPSLRMFSLGTRSKINDKPSHGHIWLSPIVPRTGEAIYEFNTMFAKAAAELGVPRVFPFLLPMCQWQRTFVFLLPFPITEDVSVNQHNRKLLLQMVKEFAARGWGEYRAPAVFHDQIVKTYSFNNNALLRFHETIKDAVDPNGILSPGRYGIWPKHMRGARK